MTDETSTPEVPTPAPAPPAAPSGGAAGEGLVVKVKIKESGAIKSLRFSPDMTVEQAIQSIRGKVELAADKVRRRNLIVFLRGKKIRKLKFEKKNKKIVKTQPNIDQEYILYIPEQKKVLSTDKLLDSYHLEKISMIELRPRLQVCAVKLMDNTVKKMFLDMQALASDVTNFVGQKIGIKITDEFGLQQDDTGEWLEPTIPLLEQFTDGQVLCLRKKYFLDDKNIDKDDPIKLHLVYVEV